MRRPMVSLLLGTAFLSRLPLGMEGLALLLFVRNETGSLASAGVVAGAFAAGIGVSAPLKGRYMDRVGLRVIPPLAAAHGLLLQAVIVVAIAGAPVAAMGILAAAAGMCLPMAGAVARAMLPAYTKSEDGERASAFALDGALTEVAFLLGPLVTTVLTASASARLALTAASILLFASGLALALSRAGEQLVRRTSDGHGLAGALRDPIVRRVLTGLLPLGVAIGSLELALIAFASTEGDANLGGVFITLMSVGAVVGSLRLPRVLRYREVADVYRRTAFLAPLGPPLLAVVPNVQLMLLASLAAGFLTGPVVTVADQLLGENLPEGRAIESMTWLMTGLTVGVAAGNALGGIVIPHGGWLMAIGAAGLFAVLTAISCLPWDRFTSRFFRRSRPSRTP